MDFNSYPSTEYLCRLYRIDDAKLALVREFGQGVTPRLPEIIDKFYEWLETQNEFQFFFQDRQILAQVKKMQRVYWEQFFQAEIDEDYVQSRRRVGKAHAAIGLPVQPYFASIEHFIQILVQPLLDSRSNGKSLKTLSAIQTLVSFDSCIALDSIFRHHAASFQEMALGNYGKDVRTRFDGDLFGIAVNQMTNTLREVENVSANIAMGKLVDKIPVKSEHDSLATSLNQMIDQLKHITNVANEVASGDYNVNVLVRSEEDELGNALQSMTNNLRHLTEERELQLWMANSVAQLSEQISGAPDRFTLTSAILEFLCDRVGALTGTFYIYDHPTLSLSATYACTMESRPAELKLGEGLLGQAAKKREFKIQKNVPDGYLDIESSVGRHAPSEILFYPFVFEGELEGIIELAGFDHIDDQHIALVSRAVETIAVSINSIRSREQISSLFEQTKMHSDQLAETNRILEDQTEILKRNDEQLRQQQVELENFNQELEEKTEFLSKQKLMLEKTGSELEEKTIKLEQASQYKSEFLANMSHELRTPLNSILILTRLFAENNDGNLNEDQISSAKVILDSGSDLLNLINDILDLSKIDAGKMEVSPSQFDLVDSLESLRLQFSPLANQAEIGMHFNIEGDVVARIKTDKTKLEQILRNLLSNAIKFTEAGYVKLNVRNYDLSKDQILFPQPDTQCLVFEVEDTGIGIPWDKQKQIFEAFRQADGSTSRKYGGTGLGLSISRECANLIGGTIALQSTLDIGSSFRLYLPITSPVLSPRVGDTPMVEAQSESKNDLKKAVQFDDRDDVGINDHCLLIIEDDVSFAQTLCDLARERKFKCLSATDGEKGLSLARQYRPKAILLDVMLPGIDGWTVFDQLKEDDQLRHIPVHFISAYEDLYEARRLGAVGFLSKPVDIEQIREALSKLEKIAESSEANVLLYEEYEDSEGLEALLASNDTNVVKIGRPDELLEKLQSQKFDIIVCHNTSLETLEQFLGKVDASSAMIPPTLVYSDHELSDEERRLLSTPRADIVKNIQTRKRLVDECILFMHKVYESLPNRQRALIESSRDFENIFNQKKVLLVDDDIRNTFSIAKLLERNGLSPVVAENGQEALDLLERDDDIDIVLMDIMMPVMDGIEAIKRIRDSEKHKSLPVIALTAKSQLRDREQCLQAGANDYLSKPIDHFRLLTMMRIWLQQNTVEMS